MRCLTLGLAILIASQAQSEDQPVFSTSVLADFEKDRGQSFGSMWEVRDGRGRVLAGAGFLDVYNTRFRSDRHTVQFFVRPEPRPELPLKIERLPHPDLDMGIYLHDFDQTVSAWSSVRGNSLRTWNPADGKWLDRPLPGIERLGPGDGVIRVGRGVMAFGGNRATYNGRQILAPPARGNYTSFYYAHGRLFFYHTDPTPAGATRIHACAWTPDDERPIDVSTAVILEGPVARETTFAWGQFRNEVLTVSNYGGVYVFDGSAWKTLRAPQLGVSYQIYSMLVFHDRLLLAQYPTGNLFEYDGEKLTHKTAWPPVMPGVALSAREAQTMAIYGGDLLVGVWPWAELWRYERDDERWQLLGRTFSHPELTEARQHPYEPEAQKHGLVANHFGQRITGMVPLGGSLLLSTSTKGTSEWSDTYGFLTDAQRREYGAVLKLDQPGNLAARMEWKESPTRLTFDVYRERLVIRQDGKAIGEASLKGATLPDFAGSTVTVGRGVYGPYSGRLSP